MLHGFLVISVMTGALFGVTVPVTALVMLTPEKYGAFSFIYLVYAYGVSLQYSVVSETWARARRKYNKGTGWPDYSAMLSSLSSVIAALALIACFSIPSLRPIAVYLGLAVLFSVYRSGARYYCLSTGLSQRVFISDFLGLVAFVVAIVVLQNAEALLLVALGWCLPAAVSCVGLGIPNLRRGLGPARWLKTHREDIRPLLADSFLMDAGAIGAPFLLVGMMGPEKFGFYRGVANVAMPVRLVLDPLRPVLGRQGSEFYFRKLILLSTAGMALVTGSVCYLALERLVPALAFDLGTLSEMAVFSLPAGVFAAASLVGTLYYIACRTGARQRTIMVGRIAQTVLVIALPIAGYLVQDLEGAVWGFSLSASVSAIIWFLLAKSDFPKPTLSKRRV